MYNFSYFKENDRQILLQFLNDNPFAFLTGSYNSGKQVATQVPVLFEERDGKLFLHGHIMRKTDHHKAFMENPQALIVFSGAHTYVSASWYTNPVNGSTWNYMSVHVSGNIRFMEDHELIQFMKKLTLKFENSNAESPTVFDNLPDTYLNKMLPAITGFEIEADDIQNVFKLSQNRDPESYRNIISRLEMRNEKGNSATIANEMKGRMGQLFPEGVEWDGSRFMS